MKAAVFTAPRQRFEIRDYPLLSPAPEMAAVSLEASGLCGTDVHIWEGALPLKGPMIPGHEFLGRVHALGSSPAGDCFGRPVSVGDRVVVNVVETCGTCALCTGGAPASCLNMVKTLTYTRSPDIPPHLHGGYAEATFAPIRYLHKVPDALPTDVAAAFLCAGPTVVCGATYAGGIRPGDCVVVQGSGPVGLFAALYAKHSGAGSVTVVGSGSHPRRLTLARELGADEALDIRTTTLDHRRSKVLALSDGLGADLIIEGAGSPDAVPEGLALLRPRGRYVWAGQYSDRGTIPIPPHAVTFNALQIFGSAQFTAHDRETYFQFLARVPHQWDTITRVITHRFTVEHADEAMARACEGATIRTIFVK